MNNLETSYMGIPLRSPVILGASELSTNNDTLKRAEDAGVAAIVYKSLFEEQVQLENLQHDEMLEEYNDIHAEMITLHPEIERSEIEHFLHVLRKAKESVSVPVIASLNAVNKSTWIKYAKLIEETGIDGIELNLYQTPTRFDRDGVAIESFQADIVSSVKDRLSIPVGVKLSSDYTNILNFAQQLDEAGVDGLVLFNAFFQPDIDIEKEKHRKSYNFSRRGDYKKSLRYAGMLYGRIAADICSSRGIFTGEDVIKLLLSGASCVQVVSAVYKYGTGVITDINNTISGWMERKGYNRIDDFKGKLSDSVLNKNDSVLIYKRAQYIDLILHSDTIFGEERL
jgi:dihydroorotate dehydrogenase (fumarate)